MSGVALRASGIRAVFERARELEKEGLSIVHMEIGRPHLNSPEAARRAAAAALEAGAVHYTQNRGLPELRAALAARLERRLGVRYDPETDVIVTAGGSEAVAASFFAALGPGDEAIVLDPAWPHYEAQLQLAGATAVHVACSPAGGFVPDPELVARAIGPRTRLLVVSSPSNPTGTVLGRETLEQLAALCLENDLLALSDETYESFVYDGASRSSIASLPGMQDRTLVVGSFSKTFSMTGWRVGYAAAPAALADRINTVHQYLTVCAPSFAQAGALAALTESEAFEAAMVEQYARSRLLVSESLAGLPGVELGPLAGAFYAFPGIAPRGALPGDLAGRLLEEAGVAVVPGEVFGQGFDRHVRISYALAEHDVREGAHRIRGFLERTA